MGWDNSDWWSFFVIAGTFIAGLVCLCIGCFFIYYFFVRPFLDKIHSRPASGLYGRSGSSAAPPPPHQGTLQALGVPHQYYYSPGQGVQQGYGSENGLPMPSDPAKYNQYAQQQQYGVNANFGMGQQAPPTQTPVFAQTPHQLQQSQSQQAQSQRGSWQQADAQSRHTPVSMHAYGDAPPVYSHQYQLPPDSTGSQGALNITSMGYNSGPQTEQREHVEVDPITGAAVRTTYRTTTTVTSNTAMAAYQPGSAV